MMSQRGVSWVILRMGTLENNALQPKEKDAGSISHQVHLYQKF